MRVAVFSTKPYDRHFLDAANASARHELAYLEPRLTLRDRHTRPRRDGRLRLRERFVVR